MKRTRQRAFAQSDILSAAAGFIATHGYHGTSMRDLAKATGRGLSSLYTYFPSKEALLFALLTRAFDTLLESADAAVPVDAPAERRLYGFMLNHIHYFLAHENVMRVLLHETRVMPKRHRSKIRKQKERYYALAEGLVAEIWMQRGRRGAMPPAELERATYGLFGVINWVWAWYEPDRHGQPRDVARTLHTLVVRGLTGRDPDRRSWEPVEASLARLHTGSPLAVPSET